MQQIQINETVRFVREFFAAAFIIEKGSLGTVMRYNDDGTYDVLTDRNLIIRVKHVEDFVRNT